MREDKLIRAIARPSPELIFQASFDCKVSVCVPSRMPDGRVQSDTVVISNRRIERNDLAGAVLPMDTWSPVHLKAGGKIYAASQSDTFLSISVEPLG